LEPVADIASPYIKNILYKISLSRFTRTKKLSKNIQEILQIAVTNIQWFSLVTDESTNVGDNAQLCFHLRYLHEIQYNRGLAALVPMKGTTIAHFQ
jgi:hypothetical protein